MKLIKEIIRQHLSESRKGFDVLILNFNPSMNPEGSEYQSYMDILQTVYPNLEWDNGTPTNNFTPSKPISQLLVGHNHTNKLMWNSIIHNPGGIDAREWLSKIQGFNTEDMFGSLYESDDSLEWAEDIVNSIPELPMVDGQRRVIRSNSDTLTLEYVSTIVDILHRNGYRISDHDGTFKQYLLLTLNRGGYLHLNPKGRLTHGSTEAVFTEANSLTFSDVPNIFI